ncbi:DUF3375 domain-containing protein [Propionibacteriaceae bacterium Y1685]|uniref:DUF3375 domain-containing protein n=1 Tax=Microlunatus sp. Y1700 TaxID=3418487 RepID=UPI003B7CE863
MTGIAGEVARIKEACDGPTLRLINHKWAALVLSVFRTSFGQQTKLVKAERLHSQVDSYLDELMSQGYDVPPNAQGRSLCQSWMRETWLKRVPSEDGEAYELTSHTLAAQGVIERLSRERALLSESRLTTILDAVRRTAQDADPDRESRISGLDAEIARLSAERDRLAEGGELLRASDERMLNGYLDVMDLMGQLPGDFRRVEEAVDRIHRQMIKNFRSEDRPKGEVLDAYLAESQTLTSQTEEGRAFEGALAILNDERLLTGLREDLRTIMQHPFVEALGLSKAERRQFLDAASVLRSGLYEVQGQQHKASRSLAEHLASHDSAQERELTLVLRRLSEELGLWMESARPRDYVPMPWMPAKVEIDHLRTRFYDPATERPTSALEDVSGLAPEPLSLEEVRRFGGPQLEDVRAGVEGALRERDLTTLGAAFNELDVDLRRPVEVFGLMHMATEWGLMDGEVRDVEVVRTVRPDGSTRQLSVPRLDASAGTVLDRQEEER